MKVILPIESWFVQKNKITGNIYSGSAGTDPARGCLCKRTFNYKVHVEEIAESELIVVVECYVQLPWSEEMKKTNFDSKTFKFLSNGISNAQEWLNGKISDFIINEK